MFQDVHYCAGLISLSGAQAATLTDDMSSWGTTTFVLDGFRYDRIAGELTSDSNNRPARVAWLKRQTPGDLTTEFKPQPWEHLIKVLRETGHPKDARAIAIAKQDQMREAGKIRHTILHRLYGWLYGYGYDPRRLFGWVALFWLLCGAAFMLAARLGVMEPTDRRVVEDIQKNYTARCSFSAPADWSRCPALATRYTAFNPFLYSLYLIVPIVSLQQAKDWAPRVVRPGAEARYDICWRFAPGNNWAVGISPTGLAFAVLAVAESLFGWVVGLMFVAVASGLIKKD